MKWNDTKEEVRNTEERPMTLMAQKQAANKEGTPSYLYRESPGTVNLSLLQQNLGNCLGIIEDEVMKGYITKLDDLPVVAPQAELAASLPEIHFFKITELVYQENEFAVYKLATVFHTLANVPCTLVLMVKSNGFCCDFYLGVRSLDSNHSTGTMMQMLKQSLLGMFPGSRIDSYYNDAMKKDMDSLKVGCLSSVTCVADFKKNNASMNNRDFVQGLEKFVYSMQGKEYTAVFIANNLGQEELAEIKRGYENIYTQISPFADMQINFAVSDGSSSMDGSTYGVTNSSSYGVSRGTNTNESVALTRSSGTNSSYGMTDTTGTNESESDGISHTVGTADGTMQSTSDSHTSGTSDSVSVGAHAGIKLGMFSLGGNVSYTHGSFESDTHTVTHGTSHTKSVSDSISKTLTHGINASHADSRNYGTNQNAGVSVTKGEGTQKGENFTLGETFNLAGSRSVTDTVGASQGITLNAKNRTLESVMKKLELQLERVEECESIGMWNFATYFLGESAAETETAANTYQAVMLGEESGVEHSAVNTWIDEEVLKNVFAYVRNFLHPCFLYDGFSYDGMRKVIVNPSAMVSTNELAIHMGLPRHSVNGLPVIEHADFGKEVVRYDVSESGGSIRLGSIFNMGRILDGSGVSLDAESLAMHTFIVGATGSGKSNTVYKLLDELTGGRDAKVHFMVIEPAKGEYKRVFGNRENVSVLGTNPEYTHLLKINPFRFPKGVHVLEHIDRLIEIFNVCWPMYAAMPAVLKEAVLAAYETCGWNMVTSVNMISEHLYPTFRDLLEQLMRVIDESAYSAEVKSNYAGALTTRVKSLTNGLSGQIFSADELDNDTLFDSNVIIDLSRVGSQETKSLLMGILVIRLAEHRMTHSAGSNDNLRHVTVLEEAHNILKSSTKPISEDGGDIAGKSVEMIANAIAEMRTYGEGFIIADQSPSAVDISAVRNTNTKIIMRLPEESDRRIAGKSAAMKELQLDEIARLPKGVAVIYQNDWIEPVLCKIDKYKGEEQEYHVCSTVEDMEINKRTASLLVNMVLRNRLDAPDKIDCGEVAKAVERSDCTARTKTILYSMLNEYRHTRKVRLWSQNDFKQQAHLVEDIINCGNAVEYARRVSTDFVGFNCLLNSCVAEKLDKVSENVLINVNHCLVKAYSEKADDGLDYYKDWRDKISERGHML